MIILIVRPCLTNSFLCLLNSQPCPTPRARLPIFTPLSTVYPPTQNRGVSRYFFPFLPISHFFALPLTIHSFAKANLFFFPNRTALPPSHYSPIHQNSQPTSFYPSREATLITIYPSRFGFIHQDHPNDVYSLLSINA